jgi:hypothetical protein
LSFNFNQCTKTQSNFSVKKATKEIEKEEIFSDLENDMDTFDENQGLGVDEQPEILNCKYSLKNSKSRNLFIKCIGIAYLGAKSHHQSITYARDDNK